MLRILAPSQFRGISRAAARPHAGHLAARAQVAAIILIGLALRAGQAMHPGLHPDEALYASWALRIAEGRDPALLGVLVDKPPFLPYLLAGLVRLAGHGSATAVDLDAFVVAARFVAVGASLVTLVLVWAIANRMAGRPAALWAAALVAISPLAVRLAPALLTDPWLVLWMVLGLWAALRGRPWSVGIACGLAFATKQQAVLVIPLILTVYWLAPHWPVSRPGITRPPRPSIASIARLAGGFLLVFTIVLWWDSLRWQWMPSYWEQSAAAYGGLQLAASGGFVERIVKWSELGGYVFGWPLLLLLILGMAGLLRSGAHRLGAFDRLLLVYVMVYLGIHLATSIAPWDRYALPLVPLLAIVLGRGAASLWDGFLAAQASGVSATGAAGSESWPDRRKAVAVLWAASGAFALWLAAFAPIPVGDASAYDGVEQVANHIRQTEPPGSILYHHWLGWHYGFYLADAPVDLRYWETPEDLAAKATAERNQRQWIAFPAGRDSTEVSRALAAAGLHLEQELAVMHPDASPSIVLYTILPIEPAEGERADQRAALPEITSSPTTGASGYDD